MTSKQCSVVGKDGLPASGLQAFHLGDADCPPPSAGKIDLAMQLNSSEVYLLYRVKDENRIYPRERSDY